MLYDEIIEIYNDIKNINSTLSLLNWDQSIYIPVNGHASRALCIESLTKKEYEIIISDLYYEKLSKITGQDEINKLSDFQRKEIFRIKKNIEKARKVPSKLVAEIARVTSTAMKFWEDARSNNDDKSYLPILQKIFELKKKLIGYIGYEKNPYNVLLDDFETGLDYDYVENVFTPLKEQLNIIIKNINDSGKEIKDDFLFKKFDYEKQKQFGLNILSEMGLDKNSFRQDISAHPFTSKIGSGDVRITTNIRENDFKKGFFSTVHEGGHCLFEISSSNNIKSPVFSTLDLLALHESQSRFYENIISRSLMFWENYYKELQKTFGDNLKKISLLNFYKAINKVTNKPVRIESDEVTYNLHIILRTELENLIINEKLQVKDINECWNEKTNELLGFYPKNKSQGYLQDIHWSDGLIGYFPTYAIGNLISAQIYYFMEKDIGGIKKIDKECLKKIFDWLNDKIYKTGSEYLSGELVKKITDEEFSSVYFINYIKEKYYSIYNINY